MLKQYLSIKEKYKDTILFYRMGDFYEMFFEDAEVASKALEITLTSRNKNDASPVPMCGVPFRAAKGYIARLIEQGYKVAICDQIEDPKDAKGLVKREVVRVITPGMIIEDELLKEKSNNYILALSHHSKIFGLSYLDISTGTFRLCESNDIIQIIEEVQRVSPSEIILPESFKTEFYPVSISTCIPETPINFMAEKTFDISRSKTKLNDLFRTISLEGFGCEKMDSGVSAAGALLCYVKETQKQKIEHFSGIEIYTLDSYLLVDDLSCRNLELLENIRTKTKKGSLIDVIDDTITAMGGRLLKHWVRYPLVDEDKIKSRLDAVEEAKLNLGTTQKLRQGLNSVYDLERLTSKISMGHANARDLIALKQSLNALPAIKSLLSSFDSEYLNWHLDLTPIMRLADVIEHTIREDAPPTITEGGMIKNGYSQKLDELFQISREGKGWLAKLESQEKHATGINTLKVKYNKVFGYFIEIPKSRSALVPEHYIRKQTLVNAERYITDELKTFEFKVTGAEDQRASLEYEIFNEIKGRIVNKTSQIQSVAGFLAHLDCLLTLAVVADQNDYTRPKMHSDGYIHIENGRHPVIEKTLTAERFVPNTIDLNETDNQILIITGPNMAGKSTILRQVALTVLLAQMGGFVPASQASLSITDRIFTRVGALDNLSSGQSTFMVEMQETANILNNATGKSLVIMDEIGRGTSTFDGLSIAWAVAEYLHDLNGKGVKTLFATHYHELTELSQKKTRVKNYNIAVKEWNDNIIFLRKLVKGGTNRSYGIQVARLAGVPDEVIEKAKTILSKIEINGDLTCLPSILMEKKDNSESKHVQLDLFQRPEQAVLEKLKNLDISLITPIEALNYLNELKEKINAIR